MAKPSIDVIELPSTIRGNLLRAFAKSMGRRRISVIVEPQKRPLAIRGPAGPIVTKRSTNALRADLAKLGLLDRARAIGLISAFVLEVTPRQLRLIASAPSVQSIRPNMMHRLL